MLANVNILTFLSQFASDTYRRFDQELVLECRVRGYPSPTISWLKDGKVLDDGRYTRKYLDDGIHRLEISNPDASDSGRYVCRASNEMQSTEMSHIVRFEGWHRNFLDSFVYLRWQMKNANAKRIYHFSRTRSRIRSQRRT